MALKFEYDKETRTAVVCGVEDKFCEQIVIPSTVEYYRKKYDVVAIKKEAFQECLKLKSVTIPDSVTEIGDYAFYGCSSLTSITIPDSVPEIGVWAFYGCSSMREFKGKFAADNGRCIIEDGALIAYASASGTTYAIPDSVTKIRGSAFSGCSSLTSVTIPNGVTEIGRFAFYGCSSLTSITIPDSVTEIGYRAFNDCSNLKEFKGKFAADNGRCLVEDGVLIAYASASGEVYAIPNGVPEIRSDAFCFCKSLTSITIPNGVTAIRSEAFKCCSNLTSVTIPNGVTEIGYSAFYGCKSLTSITIPDSVTVIGSSALSGCSNLTSVTIPNGVTKIGKSAFEGCSRLTSITIPNGVTEIQRDVFRCCRSLTSVTIPDSVTLIGDSAFRDCCSLTSVTIPNSVTKIGRSAFQLCGKLKNVDICNEKGCVNIPYDAFGSDVKVTYLGKDAQPKPKQEVKEQPAPEVATPAPAIDLDKLIDAAAADGMIADKERSVILKKAVAAGYDADEVEILIDGKIAEKQREAQPKKKGFFARLFGKK